MDSRNGCALRIGWVQKLITFSSGLVGLQKLIRRKCNEIGKGEQKKMPEMGKRCMSRDDVVYWYLIQ